MGEQKVIPIVEGMEKDWLDGVKDSFSNLFGKSNVLLIS